MTTFYPISKLIGKKIRYYRKINGLTLVQLAEIIGVSKQQQSRYENGINRINIFLLNKYAQVFNLEVSLFFVFDQIENKYINTHISILK